MKRGLIVLALVWGGCIAPLRPAPEVQKFERVFPYTLGEVWAASVTVMERKYHVLADPVEYTIYTTEWNWDIERDKEQGLSSEINWKERYKYTITLQTAREGILLTFQPWIEDQIPSKHGGVTWARKASDGRRERRFMDQIDAQLSRKRT